MLSLGPHPPPPLPLSGLFAAGGAERTTLKDHVEGNFLDAIEADISSVHAGFDSVSSLDIEPVCAGIRILAAGAAGAQQRLKVSQLIFPNALALPWGSLRWYVPVDDRFHRQYTIGFNPNLNESRSAPSLTQPRIALRTFVLEALRQERAPSGTGTEKILVLCETIPAGMNPREYVARRAREP